MSPDLQNSFSFFSVAFKLLITPYDLTALSQLKKKCPSSSFGWALAQVMELLPSLADAELRLGEST